MIEAAISGLLEVTVKVWGCVARGGGEQGLRVALLRGDGQVGDRLQSGGQELTVLEGLETAAAGSSGGLAFWWSPRRVVSRWTGRPESGPTYDTSCKLDSRGHPPAARRAQAARSPSVTPSVSVLRFALLDRDESNVPRCDGVTRAARIRREPDLPSRPSPMLEPRSFPV